MNKGELINRLLELQETPDCEYAHQKADEALLDYINDEEIREEFDNIEKYYS